MVDATSSQWNGKKLYIVKRDMRMSLCANTYDKIKYKKNNIKTQHIDAIYNKQTSYPTHLSKVKWALINHSFSTKQY